MRLSIGLIQVMACRDEGRKVIYIVRNKENAILISVDMQLNLFNDELLRISI